MTTKLEAPAQEPRNVDGGGTASLAGVSRAFGPVRALEGVDLEVGAGEIVAVVGPSGCGKTTLLELVCGLQAPDAGTRARRPRGAHAPARPPAAVAARDRQRRARRCAWAGRRATRRAPRAHPLFAAFGLEGFERARPHELSGGMRQRVAFLRTLLSGKPRAVPRRAVRRARRAHARARCRTGWRRRCSREPRTVLLVTHDVEEAARAGRPRRRPLAPARARGGRSSPCPRAALGGRRARRARAGAGGAARMIVAAARRGAARRLGALRRPRRRRRLHPPRPQPDRHRAVGRPLAAVVQPARDRPGGRARDPRSRSCSASCSPSRCTSRARCAAPSTRCSSPRRPSRS